MSRQCLLGLLIDWVTNDQLKTRLIEFLESKTPHQITTVNPEFIVAAQTNPEFKQVLIESDLSLADGAGVVIGQLCLAGKAKPKSFMRIINYKIALIRFLFGLSHLNRQTGVKLAKTLVELSHLAGYKIFLLGARPGVANRAKANWLKVFPNANFIGLSAANPDDNNLIPEIVKTNPDILLVAYGAPKQDLFIANNRQNLNIPIMVGVGGTFDYVAKDLLMAPRFLQQIGLEWLVRLILQPARWRRIWRATVVYSWLVISYKK